MNPCDSLESLQLQLQRHVLCGDRTVAAAVVPGGIGVERRLQVYQRAYRARLLDCLRDTFGHTASYLGAERFEAEALAHVEDHPSRHDSLRDYGVDFPDGLAARHPDAAELAMLDLALRRAFDGPDAGVLALADLAAVPRESWPAVRFTVQPTTRRLRLGRNTLAIWQAIDGGTEPPPPRPLERPLELLIWRVDHRPNFRSLDDTEAVAVDAVLAGATLGELCERLAGRLPATEVAREAGAMLRRWVDEALLAELILAAD